MVDISGAFNVKTCFLCAGKADIDFHCFYDGELYRALVCLECMWTYPDDLAVLAAIIEKADKLTQGEINHADPPETAGPD